MFTAWSEIKFLASKAFVQSLNLITTKHCEAMAVVVAQLAEWSVHTTRPGMANLKNIVTQPDSS